MSKRIAVCTDGTWDSSANNSNVYKIFKAMLKIPGEQTPFYDDGVGADGTLIEKLAGGAFGDGLYKKIKEAYSEIAHVYEDNDEVFLFGFSRGAYTARSLAGMIAVCGLPIKPHDSDLVDTAFQAYRNKDQRAGLLAGLAPYGMVDAKIAMVGVWDTVGSLGIPAAFGGVSPLLYGFLDTGLHSDVLHAYHAVSIDERRKQFPATLWTSAPTSNQTIEQVYFSGVHCDVGGGYADDANGTALSDITLGWMIAKAQALGMKFDPSALRKYPFPANPEDALDTKHESWSPFPWLWPEHRKIAANATLSNSVVLRCRHDPGYRPSNLKFSSGAPAGYSIVDTVAGPDGKAAEAGA